MLRCQMLQDFDYKTNNPKKVNDIICHGMQFVCHGNEQRIKNIYVNGLVQKEYIKIILENVSNSLPYLLQ